MQPSKKLVFFGTEDFSVLALQRLIEAGWPILAVVTKPDSPSGRGQRITSPKVVAVAKKAEVKILQPEKLSDIKKELVELKPDMGILVAYGRLLPQEVIDIFPDGIVNLHPSMLPKYRGPSPIEAAILNGDTDTGISLMRLTAGMDEGPVYDQKRVSLKGDEDRLVLYKALAELGADFLLERLEPIAKGWLTPKPQIEADASYTKLINKDDGRLNFHKPAEMLERQIRAYAGWPRSRAAIHGQEIIATKARVAKVKSDGKLVIECNPGYLEIEELIAPSGKSITGADFLRGYPSG
jgi:methionyl-tRNA formyltransferase